MLPITIVGFAFFAGGILAKPSPVEKRATACIKEALATITPCPSCPSDQYPSPITITTQNQAYSTYLPMNTVCAADGSCTTAYQVSQGYWVSTIVPCYGSGYACTVTDVSQVVTLSAAQSYSVASYGCAGAGVYTIPNGDITSVGSATTIYYAQSYQTYYIAPYNQIGQYVVPGYAGSGSCDVCGSDGGTQYITVQQCCNGICQSYSETWQLSVYESPQIVYIPYVVTQILTTNGPYTFTDIDITVTVTDAPTTITVSTSTPNTVTATLTNTNTLTGSSTTTEISTATAIADTTIDDYIIIQVSPDGLTKRQDDTTSGYIAIVDDLATVVSDETDASLFTLEDGVLMFDGKFVGANDSDIDNGNARFQVYDSPPDVAATWAAVLGGGINFSNDLFTYDNGDAGVCSDSNGDVYFLFTTKDGLTCTTLQLTALDGGAQDDSSATTTAEPEPTATDSAVPTDTSEPTATDSAVPTDTDTDEPTASATDTAQPTDTDEPIATTSNDSSPTSTDIEATTTGLISSSVTATSTSPITTSLSVSTSATTTSSQTSTTSVDPSADGDFDASAVETAVPAKHRKRSFRANVVRRGGLFRSPLKKRG